MGAGAGSESSGHRGVRIGDDGALVVAVRPDWRERDRCGVCRRRGPWARHGSRFTRAFEDQVAWLAVHCSKTAVAALMRIAWRTVGAIVERVAEEATREVDLLSGLTRIGIDEISHRRGQRYLTVVVDHDTGRLVWAAAGRDRRTVDAFLDALGPERCMQIELVSADMAAWVAGP